MNFGMDPELPLTTTLEVRDRCLCLYAQRAARALARRFDHAFKPLGINNGQFSILMALNQPKPPRISSLAEFLAMDRTTLTAALKVLERRGLVTRNSDRDDKRKRRLQLSEEGCALLKQAVPIWRAEHDAVDAELQSNDVGALKSALARLGQGG